MVDSVPGPGHVVSSGSSMLAHDLIRYTCGRRSLPGSVAAMLRAFTHLHARQLTSDTCIYGAIDMGWKSGDVITRRGRKGDLCPRTPGRLSRDRWSSPFTYPRQKHQSRQTYPQLSYVFSAAAVAFAVEFHHLLAE